MADLIRNHMMELLQAKATSEGRKISLLQMSLETGLRIASLSHWKNQRITRFDAITLMRLCAYLNCEIGELLEYVRDQRENEQIS